MPPKKDKCKKQADCGCGCAKKTKRKRAAKPKNYAGAKMVGFMPRGEPFMAPITSIAPVAPVAPVAAPVARPIVIPAIPEGPSIRMAPTPSAPVMDQPKPAKYSRIAKAPSAIVAPAVPLVEPLGRYSNRIVGTSSKPASSLSDVGAKPVKEKKKALTSTDVTRSSLSEPITMSKGYSQYSTQLKERKSINVEQPTTPTILSPDLNLRGALERPTQAAPKSLITKAAPLTERGEGRKLSKKQQVFVEPAPLSRPSMMASDMTGQMVRRVKESGGEREGAGRPFKEPIEKAPPYDKRQ